MVAAVQVGLQVQLVQQVLVRPNQQTMAELLLNTHKQATTIYQ